MRYIEEKDTKLALVLDSEFDKGTTPFTDSEWPLQGLTLVHKKGKELVAHKHEPKMRQTEKMMEFLMVLSGKIEVDVYGMKDDLIETVSLVSGQGLLSIDGGIGIRIMEDAKMIELKNGPFIEDKVDIK